MVAAFGVRDRWRGRSPTSALFLSAIAGPDPRSPLSIQEDPARFRAPLERTFKGARIAWWKGLGGIPVEPEIRTVIDANRRVFESLGCVIEDAEPDFTGVADAFPVLRYASNYAQNSALVRQRPEWVKDTIKYEVAQAERLTAADVGRAAARQTLMYEQSRQFFEQYDYFVLPVTQVAPFDVTVPYPTSIAGSAMTTYIDWMRIVLVRDVHVEPGDLRAGRLHGSRSARRSADRRPPS